MALLTPMTLKEAQSIGAHFGLQLRTLRPIVHGSVNSNFAADLVDGSCIFLRVCEQSDAAMVRQSNRLLEHLVQGGVPTPAPLRRQDRGGSVAHHRGRPVALFPFVAGSWICQQRVNGERLSQIGKALGEIHQVGRSFDDPPPNRFSAAQLQARLDTLMEQTLSAPLHSSCHLLAERLAELSDRPADFEPAIIHGDVFRDNVLWHPDGTLAAVLDFESASAGNPAFDLMVTMLAWCYGDTLEQPLARSLIAGYRLSAPLSTAMLSQCYDEARAAAVRFAITRISDYELRPRDVVAYKDYRRFLNRLAVIEAMGPAHFTNWLAG